MKNNLTPKQEMFVQGIVSGLSQQQAYREAFPNAQKWKDILFTTIKLEN